MARKTIDVNVLVRDVLKTIKKPYSEDITEDVCLKIQQSDFFLTKFNELKDQLSENVVRRYIGVYTKANTGLNNIRKVKAKRSKLITSYTKLGHFN